MVAKWCWTCQVVGFAALALLTASCGTPVAPAPVTSPEATPPVQPEPGGQAVVTCTDSFESPAPVKPPLPPGNLPVYPGLDGYLNPNRRIGFNFIDSDAALIAQPVAAHCSFDDPSLGVALGAAWVLNADGTLEADYVVALSEEVLKEPQVGQWVQGALVRGDGKVQPADFFVERVITPNERAMLVGGEEIAFDPALPFDVAIRANSICFMVSTPESGFYRYCSHPGNVPELSVRQLFREIFDAQVVMPLTESLKLLIESQLLPEDSSVNFDQAISEIQDPYRIGECYPGEPGTCRGDLVVGALWTPEAPSGTVMPAIVYAPLPVYFPGNETEIKPGSFVVIAQAGERGLPMPPTQFTGYLYDRETEANLDEEPTVFDVPSTVAPLANPEADVGIVEIQGVVIWVICVGECAVLD